MNENPMKPSFDVQVARLKARLYKEIEHQMTKKKSLDKALKIANDINEGIDCGEGRKELRKCISALRDALEIAQEQLALQRDQDAATRLREIIRTTMKTYPPEPPYPAPRFFFFFFAPILT